MNFRKQVDRIYCSNCTRNLHNEYEYKGNKAVVLVKRRCKGEVFDQVFRTKKRENDEVIKCECRCQTHYKYEGYIVPIGQTPEKVDRILAKAKIKPLSPELQKRLNDWKKNQIYPFPLVDNKFLGKVGAEKDHVVKKDEEENVAGGYVFKDTLEKMAK